MGQVAFRGLERKAELMAQKEVELLRKLEYNQHFLADKMSDLIALRNNQIEFINLTSSKTNINNLDLKSFTTQNEKKLTKEIKNLQILINNQIENLL